MQNELNKNHECFYKKASMSLYSYPITETDSINNISLFDVFVYVVKESGQFSCRGFRCLNVGFFLLKIVVFVFLGTVV